MNRPTLLACFAALVLGATWTAPCPAQEKPIRPPSKVPPKNELPKDTAILEIDAPPGTKVSIDGEGVGSERRRTYRGLDVGQRKESDVLARFQEGGEVRRKVILQGGWQVRLPLRPPQAGVPELFLQTGHTNSVGSLIFSADGKHLVTGSGDGTSILWDASTGRKLQTFPGVVGPRSFSRDGKYLVTAAVESYGKGTAVLWEIISRRQVRDFEWQTHWTSDWVISPDGKYFASYSRDGGCVLWEPASGQSRSLPGNEICVAFSPDGKYLATGSRDGVATLWDTARGQSVRTFNDHSRALVSVHFSPNGKYLATGSSGAVTLWETATGQKLRTFHVAIDPRFLTFSSDGKYLAVGSWDRTPILWDVETGQQLRGFQGSEGGSGRVRFSPDDKYLVTTGLWEEKAAKLWELSSGKLIAALKGHTSTVEAVAFSPDGKYLATGSHDNTAKLWDAATGQELRTFPGHTTIGSVAFTPDKKYLAIGSFRNPFTLWEMATGQVRFFREASVRAAFSPDGKHFVTGSKDKSAILWDVPTGQKLRTFEGHRHDGPWSMAFSPDGKKLATGSNDDTLILWDVSTGQKLLTCEGHDRAPMAKGEEGTSFSFHSIAFSPDGKYVVTGCGGKESGQDAALLWDVSTGRKLRTFGGNLSVTSVAFSPSGNELVTAGSYDSTAMLWDVGSGKKLRTFQGHTKGVEVVALSLDGTLLATASRDGTANLWDVSTGQKLRTFRGHTDSVRRLSFSPNGRWIATGSDDGTVRLWDVATGDEATRLIPLGNNQDWLVATPEGLFDGTEDGRQKVSWRIGKGLTVVPVDRFFQDFYHPGLLAAIMGGARPMPTIELGKSQAPGVRIVSPRESAVVETNQVALDVKITDEGSGVQGPWLMHNGARVLAGQQGQRDGKLRTQRFLVSLVEGDNRLEVRAASGDGSMESEPARITLRYQRPLQKPSLHVVAVGINRYADGAMNLKFAGSDARAVVELFEKRGRSLYRDVETHLLLDETATREGIRQVLTDIAKKAKPQDTLLVFIAGHGAMVGQRYYFVPHEFSRQREKSLEDDIRAQGLPADVLNDDMGAVPALKRILVLDTCHSGGAVGLVKLGRDPFALRGAIERLNRQQGNFIIAAASAGDEAKEVPELGHGVLTYTLLAGLGAVDKGPLQDRPLRPTNSERVVGVLEWFDFASGNVQRLTRQYFGREQDVHTGGRGNSFPVLPVEER